MARDRRSITRSFNLQKEQAARNRRLSKQVLNCIKDASPSPAILGDWWFGHVKPRPLILCRINLTDTPGDHGFVIIACNANESYWRPEGPDRIVFLHADGSITSRLTRTSATRWEGPYIPHPSNPLPGVVHYIER